MGKDEQWHGDEMQRKAKDWQCLERSGKGVAQKRNATQRKREGLAMF